jgi:hypothetical protein
LKENQVQRLLLVLHDLEVVFREKLVVAFGREVQGGSRHAEGGEEECSEGGGAEGPGGVEVVAWEVEAGVGGEEVGLGVLAGGNMHLGRER